MDNAIGANYRTSEQVQELFTALSAAQKVMAGATKDATNPHFGNKYADLASVWDACRGPLADNGLCVFQPVTAEGAKVTVTTLLAHKSGQWISSDLTLTSDKATAQGTGSAITYGRRYGLSAMVGIAPEDDDGNAASGSKQAQQEVVQRKLAAKPKERDRSSEGATVPTLPAEIEALFQPKVAEGATARAISFVRVKLLEVLDQDHVDSEYREIMEHNGVHAGKGNSNVQVRNAVMQCYTRYNQLKAALPKPSLTDLPEGQGRDHSQDVPAEWQEGRE